MGVYINMEMPKNGSCIQIVIDDDGKVYPSVEKCILKMGSIAKAVPVLSHGRLIDADALEASCFMGSSSFYTQSDIDYAPTIIPASEEEI